jgi:hypothetical protein
MATISSNTNTALGILSGSNNFWRVSYPVTRTSIDTNSDDMAKRPSDIIANLDDERERTAIFTTSHRMDRQIGLERPRHRLVCLVGMRQIFGQSFPGGHFLLREPASHLLSRQDDDAARTTRMGGYTLG